MICDVCYSFWLRAILNGTIQLSEIGSVVWTQHRDLLQCTAGQIKSKLDPAQPRCSICVCIWFGLTDAERSSLPAAAACELELQLDQVQNKPSLRAKFIDRDGHDIVPSRLIAMYEKESDDGMAFPFHFLLI